MHLEAIMRNQFQDQPVAYNLLLTALMFQGISGIFGGLGLMIDPSGETLQIPVSWLQGSPFEDYLIPGIILFSVLGIFPMMVAYGVWKRYRFSWAASLLVGDFLVIWIIAEVMIIGYHSNPPLQLFYGILGGVIFLLTLTPSVRTYIVSGPLAE